VYSGGQWVRGREGAGRMEGLGGGGGGFGRLIFA
jgi:hypothetical protein